MWVVVKIRVPLWTPIINTAAINYLGYPKGAISKTETHQERSRFHAYLDREMLYLGWLPRFEEVLFLPKQLLMGSGYACCRLVCRREYEFKL